MLSREAVEAQASKKRSKKRKGDQTVIPWVSKLKRPSSRVEAGYLKRDQILVFGFTVACAEVVFGWFLPGMPCFDSIEDCTRALS